VQGDKGNLDALLRQARGQIAPGIDGHRQVTGLQKGVQYRFAGTQRDLPFGRESAHEYTNGLFLKLLAGHNFSLSMPVHFLPLSDPRRQF
jgi:hypothetical protein